MVNGAAAFASDGVVPRTPMVAICRDYTGQVSSDVAVVIPTTGRPSLLRAVRSVIGQVEQIVVVVDDLESLDSVEQQLSNVGTPIQVLATSGGQGGAAARALGTAKSELRWTAYLDDDDWWDSERVAGTLGRLKAKTTFTMTRALFHRKNGKVVVLPKSVHPGDPLSAALERKRLRSNTGLVQTSTFMVRTGLARAVDWRPSLQKHQDWDFFYRASRSHAFQLEVIHEPLVHITQGSTGSVSRRLDWRASAAWIEEVHVAPRAKADFVACQVLRAAVANREFEPFKVAVKSCWSLKRSPHLSALAVAASAARR